MPEAVPTCPQCARPVPPNAAKCPYDGTPLGPQLGDAPLPPTFVKASGAKPAPDWTEPTATRPPDDNATVMIDQAYAGETDRAIDPLVGAQLGDYVLGERLGSGGMGLVYAGEQPMIGKKVAIKILRPEIASDEKNVARLLAEARAVNAIRHRGIIDIFNFGKLPDGRNYIVMEYLSGEPLDVMLHRRGHLPPVEVIDVLNEILSALGAGHGAGIIHRDLKPSNIHVVTEPNGQKYLKVLDFGLAKSNMFAGKAMTHTNVVVGTPEYMAPEQARAELVSPQSDLYALGIIAFELLTGKLPFSANSPFEWMLQQVNTPAPKPSSVRASVPPELDALVLRLLAKKEADRPPTAESVREELARIRKVITERDAEAVKMSSFPAAMGVTGPKQAFTDEMLQAARAQAAARASAPKPSSTRPPARGGNTGPRPAYVPPAPAAAAKATTEPGGPAAPPPRPAPPPKDPDTLKGQSAPLRSDTIMTIPVAPEPGSKIPLLAALLALIGIGAAAGGYYVYRESQLPQPLTEQRSTPEPKDPIKDPPKKVEAHPETPKKTVDAANDTDKKPVDDKKPDTVQVVAHNTNDTVTKVTVKKDPVVKPNRKAVLLTEVASLRTKLDDASNVKAEAGSALLVKAKLSALRKQIDEAANDKDLELADKSLREIKTTHFR